MNDKFQSPSGRISSGGILTSQHQLSSNYYATNATCKQEQSFVTLNSAPVMSGLHGQQIGAADDEKLNKSFVKTEQNSDSTPRFYQMQVGPNLHCSGGSHYCSSIKEEIISKPFNYNYDVQSVYSQPESSISSSSYQPSNGYLFQQETDSCQANNYKHNMALTTERKNTRVRKSGKVWILFSLLKQTLTAHLCDLRYV